MDRIGGRVRDQVADADVNRDDASRRSPLGAQLDDEEVWSQRQDSTPSNLPHPGRVPGSITFGP
jgi:hypothetical protein